MATEFSLTKFREIMSGYYKKERDRCETTLSRIINAVGTEKSESDQIDDVLTILKEHYERSESAQQ